MYASWSTDLQEHHAHQRKIVRHFAPHLSNDALTWQERVYFAVGITRIIAVFVVPSVVVLLTHAWFLKTPVFVLVALVAAFELGMAIYRYFVLWPEGQSMRWNYWREIEMAQDCYKLKIMGYYHRKIAKFTGRFPSTMASSEIHRHYRTRGAVMVSLFSIAFVASLVLLAHARDDETVWTWITYLLAIGSGVVIFRFIKMHFIELPQVLLLRDHPEFAVVLIPPSESIPFARPIRAYDAMEEEPLRVATSLSTEKVTNNIAFAAAPEPPLFPSLCLHLNPPLDAPRCHRRMSRPSRCLEYAGVDAAWEARELRAFSGPQNAIRSANAVSNYLLGRLLEEDLHVSCKPMLPADIQTMNRSMLQGTCLLQVVDIVNIGANFEHRTEDSKGPTRTLKVCLTDGHQTVFGFEYKWIPALTVKTPRGTKVLVQNVAVRHGVMMLTPETCQVLGASGNDTLDVSRAQSSALMSSDERPSGAYSAALMTVGANLLAHKTTNEVPFAPARTTPPTHTSNKSNQVSPEVATPMSPRAHNLPRTAAELIGSRFFTPQPPAAVPVQHHPSNLSPTSTLAATPSTSRLNAFSPPRRKPDTVTPAVFVDISSGDDDTASDVTDPMVEHLFYSPNTPRITDAASRNHRPQQPSRKRPHPESIRSKPTPPPVSAGHADVVDMTTSPPTHTLDSEQSEQPTFSLLPTVSTPPLTSPFVYFSSRKPALSVSSAHTQVGTILTIRGFMKSVAGFQFNTGVYNLRVLIEDGTATKDVQVDPALVESLMGVSCAEFANAMQSSTPTVAHQLAAKMQVTLMTMQGIMRLRLDTAPDKWTLLQCREYTRSETHALLVRVQHHAHEDRHEHKR